jgi:hypothetical protein
MRRNRVLKMVAALPLVVLLLALFGYVVMSLWNWLMPLLFGWHVITFWQALGIFVLSKILFGGLRGGHGGRWRHRLNERWEHMTPEEREKFRDGMRGRCGPFGGAAAEPKG